MSPARGITASLVVLTFAAVPAWAQPLPEAEITQVQPDATELPETGTLNADSAMAIEAERPFIEVYSRGYSRFEIGADGHILVVYSGGVQFSYLGFELRADELRFDQATRSAVVSGDVRFASDELLLSSQRIELDGIAGRGTVNGHLVGSLRETGVRFEAARAELEFPPGAAELAADQVRLTLSGEVAIVGPDGSEMRTEQIAFDGAARRFSTAPFSLRGLAERPAGANPAPIQIHGAAAGGMLSENGDIAELKVLSLLAVSSGVRFSAAQAVARPRAYASWLIEASGSPLRLEVESAELPFPSPAVEEAQAGEAVRAETEDPTSAGPLLFQAETASVEMDGAGLRAAGLAGEVIVSAMGNRLEAGAVSVTRRAAGYAVSVSAVRLGLHLARLTGIQPVDLSDLID